MVWARVGLKAVARKVARRWRACCRPPPAQRLPGVPRAARRSRPRARGRPCGRPQGRSSPAPAQLVTPPRARAHRPRRPAGAPPPFSVTPSLTQNLVPTFGAKFGSKLWCQKMSQTSSHFQMAPPRSGPGPGLGVRRFGSASGRRARGAQFRVRARVGGAQIRVRVRSPSAGGAEAPRPAA